MDSDCSLTQGSHKPIHLERRNCQKAYSAPVPDTAKAPFEALISGLAENDITPPPSKKSLRFFFFCPAAFVITELAFLRVDAQNCVAAIAAHIEEELPGH